MKAASIILVALLGLGADNRHTERSQRNLIKVGSNILVSGDKPTNPHVEPFVVSDPKDPRHLLAASIAYTKADGDSTCVVFTSFDGGQTWSRAQLPALDSMERAGDPWTAFGPDSRAYFCCLAQVTEGANKRHAIVVYVSVDGGRRWSKPLRLPFGDGGSYDHPTITVDRTSSAFSGRVYVSAAQDVRVPLVKGTSRIVVFRSTDGGSSFADPIQIHPNDFWHQDGNMTVLSDGTVIAPFFEVSINEVMLAHSRVWLVRSSDGGQSFSTAYYVAELDGTGSFLRMATDESSGKYRDHLYMVRHVKAINGEHSHISLWSSSNKGATWEHVVDFNAGLGNGIEQWHPVVAVNKDGIVGAAWKQTRKGQAKKYWDVIFTASLDGGKTFLPRVRVTSIRSCPDTPANNIPAFPRLGTMTISQRWISGGDYSGLTAGSDGLFHLMWADSRTGVYQIWTAGIGVARE